MRGVDETVDGSVVCAMAADKTVQVIGRCEGTAGYVCFVGTVDGCVVWATAADKTVQVMGRCEGTAG